MKLYKITASRTTTETEVDRITSWSGSQADAAKTRKRFNSELKFKRDDITTDEVEVPTNKAGLIDFLNAL